MTLSSASPDVPPPHDGVTREVFEEPSPTISSPFEGTDLVAIDTETTGLWWGERLVELGAVRFRGDRVIDRWRTLVDPRRAIPEVVSKIHGITDAQVAGAPVAGEVLRELARFCEGAALLAHNAPFDRDILATELVRAGIAPPDLKVYCTWRLAKRCIPGSPRYGLAALAAHLGLPSESPHRALADAELTRRLFLECAARTPDALADCGDLTFSLTGAVQVVRDLPRRLRALRVARALGRGVTLTVGAEGENPAELRGVPRMLYARGREVGVDLLGEDGRVVSLGAERILSIR